MGRPAIGGILWAGVQTLADGLLELDSRRRLEGQQTGLKQEQKGNDAVLVETADLTYTGPGGATLKLRP